MNLRLLYFARLREVFGRGVEEVDLPAHITDVGALVAWLRERGDPWAVELAPGRSFRVALDQEMVSLQTALKPGAEVAIFPPVTGG